jgi:hypothetical protein
MAAVEASQITPVATRPSTRTATKALAIVMPIGPLAIAVGERLS